MPRAAGTLPGQDLPYRFQGRFGKSAPEAASHRAGTRFKTAFNRRQRADPGGSAPVGRPSGPQSPPGATAAVPSGARSLPLWRIVATGRMGVVSLWGLGHPVHLPTVPSRAPHPSSPYPPGTVRTRYPGVYLPPGCLSPITAAPVLRCRCAEDGDPARLRRLPIGATIFALLANYVTDRQKVALPGGVGDTALTRHFPPAGRRIPIPVGLRGGVDGPATLV